VVVEDKIDKVDARLVVVEDTLNKVTEDVGEIKETLESVEFRVYTKHENRITRIEDDMRLVKTKVGV
jgi:archaellum component FlaC